MEILKIAFKQGTYSGLIIGLYGILLMSFDVDPLGIAKYPGLAVITYFVITAMKQVKLLPELSHFSFPMAFRVGVHTSMASAGLAACVLYLGTVYFQFDLIGLSLRTLESIITIYDAIYGTDQVLLKLPPEEELANVTVGTIAWNDFMAKFWGGIVAAAIVALVLKTKAPATKSNTPS